MEHGLVAFLSPTNIFIKYVEPTAFSFVISPVQFTEEKLMIEDWVEEEYASLDLGDARLNLSLIHI